MTIQSCSCGNAISVTCFVLSWSFSLRFTPVVVNAVLSVQGNVDGLQSGQDRSDEMMPNDTIDGDQSSLIERTDGGNAFELRQPGALNAVVTTSAAASIEQSMPHLASATPALSDRTDRRLCDTQIVKAQKHVDVSVLDASNIESAYDKHGKVPASETSDGGSRPGSVSGISDDDIQSGLKLKVVTTKGSRVCH